ncbi:MAG TPA: aminoglycoside phosphotransferase family protein [Pseudonocardiaceae bacterium]|jgi:hypothetical protein|nr:aminoglycoside phosphotransferase family protein [Pseudonocardiaceae bacterium]
MSDSTATLTLVDPHGRPLGTLPPLPVESPWWKDVAEIVEGTRERDGIDVVVLRLLTAGRPRPPGGAVTYLAEYDGPPVPGLIPTEERPSWLAPHPLRLPWAEIGGPARSLAWADGVLADLGWKVSGRRQIRSWNLSSIWRIDTDRGPVWLKEVPPFMAHEGAVLRWLSRPTTTVVLGADERRMLLADIPGTDRYEAGPAERAGMLAALLDIQTEAVARLGELTALGVPTEYGDDFGAEAEILLPRWLATLSDADDRAVLTDLVDGLAARFAEVEACGVPYTLVHGDFHPGNVRSDGTNTVIIDWGDARLGHPVMDMMLMRDWRGGDPVTFAALWCAHWRRVLPGCEPDRVVELMEPVAALRGALIYGMFLRSIEPAERPYHDDDVPMALRAAIDQHRRVARPATHM